MTVFRDEQSEKILVACQGEPLTQPRLWVGHQWAVTPYGVECRDGTYAIEKDRLWEDSGTWGWELHMAEKEWVKIEDFRMALAWARDHFADLKPE